LLAKTGAALQRVVSAIRGWYEAQDLAVQQLLVSVKLGEEVDIGANFYYYPNGNGIVRSNPTNTSADPRYGANWSQGIAGGLAAQGYNMLQTLDIRQSGGPPTREEISLGVKTYFTSIVGSCVEAWPALLTNGVLATHTGLSSDTLIKWSAGMVAPATPGYSFYYGPATPVIGQVGLKKALLAYNPGTPRRGEFIIAESACFGCGTPSDWVQYFRLAFHSPFGIVRQLRYYNLEPFVGQEGAIQGLHEFVNGWE